MKRYLVIVLREFDDLKEKKHRDENDTFKCTKKRYEFLKENNAVELVMINKK